MLDDHYRGSEKTISWYVDVAGVAHGREYYSSLPTAQQVKFEAPFRYVADQPRYRNSEKFTPEADDFFAFKIHKHRLICFQEGRLLIITHGYVKKRDDVPPGEIDRASRLRDEYQSRRRRR